MSLEQVSVIIPAFNSASWIREAVESVVRQSFPPHEIIVVDDGSTDSTADILSQYGDTVHYVRQKNCGVAAARNTGVALARGDFMAFLDADDVWHPRKLELQLRAIANRPEIGLIGTDRFAWPAATMPVCSERDILQLRLVDRGQLAVRNCFTASSVMLRRQAVEKIGYFDTALCGPEDHDYWLRAVDAATAAILPIPLTGYRSVPMSLSKRAGPMEAGMKRVLLKLDARDYWRGDRLLRRQAYGYTSYASAYMHGATGRHFTSISRLLRSLVWYPLPFHRSESGASFGRFRRLIVTMLRLVRAMKSEPLV
jgi:glycosyltransferase involved in cell wall biosynthesis